MASLIKRPTNYVRSSRLNGREEEFDNDFFLYEDEEEEEEPDYLIVNEALKELNLHVLLYVAAWYTGKSLDPQKYRNVQEDDRRSAFRRSVFGFAPSTSSQLNLIEISAESLNNALKNDIAKAKDFMCLHHRKIWEQRVDGENLKYREVILPLYFIIHHRSRILSNSIVSLTEDELREFCVKLVWAHPPSLYTRGIFHTLKESDNNESIHYNTSSLSRVCTLAKDYAREDKTTKDVLILHQPRTSQREPPEYALLRPLIHWLEAVYGKTLVKQIGFDNDNSLNMMWSKRISMNISDRRSLLRNTQEIKTTQGRTEMATELFEIPLEGGKQINENNDFLKSCYIERIAPAQALYVNHEVLFVLELLSEILDKSVSHDYFKTYLHHNFDEDLARRSLNEPGNLLNVLQNGVDEGIDIMISVIAAIPGFIKTSLFVKEDDRQRIFSCTAMKHILLDDEDMRFWLVPLLRLDSSCVMFYMNYISSYLHPDVNGIIYEADLLLLDAKEKLGDDDKSLHKLEFITYLQEKRDKFFERFYINRIDRHIFYAITSMDTEMQEKSAGIQSIQLLVDNVFRSSRFPFVLLIVDGIMNVFVQASLQVTLLYALLYIEIEYYAFASIVAFYSIMYFVVREILQTCSFRTFSEFKAVFISIWNIVDWFTIGLVITALISISRNIFRRTGEEYTNYLFSDPKPIVHDILNMTEAILHNSNATMYESAREQFNIAPKYIYTIGAFAILLQSLHFIFYLRLLNEDLAVLIFSITEVTKNVKWFMVVLVFMIYVFSQIFLVLLPVQGSQVPCVFKDDVETAVDLAHLQLMSVTSIELSRRELDETMEDSLVVCNQGINYKYVYEMMYGTWENGAFDGDRLYLFFVLFTLYVTLIMLNILIAIASDSFASVNTKGPLIYRVLRIEFLAEAISIEDLFCYDEAYGDERKKIRWRYNVMLFFVLIAGIGSCVYSCSIIWRMADFEVEWEAGSKPLEPNKNASCLYVAIGSLIFCVVFSIVTFFVVAFSARKWTIDQSKEHSVFYKFIDYIICLVVNFGRRMVGFIEQGE